MEQIRGDLERQLGERVLEVSNIPEGHSGFTYWVQLEGRLAVMRLPPPGARISGPADIPRQGRLMQRLYQAGLPVPAVIAMSDEPVVDGRPYYLLEAVDGERIEKLMGRVPALSIAQSAVDVLKRLQQLPLDQTGIGHEQPATLDQEIGRWAWLMERAPEELTGRAHLLGGRLAETRPSPQAPTLVHGDYHYGNMLFRGGEVVGVLDWEIAELGPPEVDVACLAVTALRRSMPGLNPGGEVAVTFVDVIRAAGPGYRELPWFIAAGCYKYAAILAYNLDLHLRGKRVDPVYVDEAKRDRISGIVILEVLVAKSGAIKDAVVLQGLPDGLSDTAVAAVKQWQFEPGTLKGEPVDVILNLTINFSLDSAS